MTTPSGMAIHQQDSESRLYYFLDQVVYHKQVWVLTDEHGCVMLNTEDEDAIPVWPSQDYAQAWATEEWDHCTAEEIPLDTWLSRWTSGLMDDELSIVVFPNEQQEGIVLYPEELEELIKKKQRKAAR